VSTAVCLLIALIKTIIIIIFIGITCTGAEIKNKVEQKNVKTRIIQEP